MDGVLVLLALVARRPVLLPAGEVRWMAGRLDFLAGDVVLGPAVLG